MRTKLLSIFFILSCMLLTACNKSKATSDNMHGKAVLKIMVDYEKQEGPGSNQWAVWIEDTQGNLVKTIYVTSFTADGGYIPRPACTPIWVSKANPASLSGALIDGFSGATPDSGMQTYTWDLTDDGESAVGNGEYYFVVEATLFGESEVIYKAPFTVDDKESNMIEADPSFTSEDEKNKEMIKSVTAQYVLLK